LSLSTSCAPAKPGKDLDPWFIISTEFAGPQIIRIYEKRFGSLGVAVILDISGHAPCDFAAK
jgi:hypothetical protein